MSKKMKLSTIVIAVVLVVAAIAGTTFMWFFNSVNMASAGNATAAKINLEGKPTASFKIENVLPGQDIKFKDIVSLKYDGTRDAVLRIELDGVDNFTLKGDITAHDDYKVLSAADKADYVLVGRDWTYTDARIKEIIKLAFAGQNVSVVLYPNADGTALYAYLKPANTGAELLADGSIKFTGEFGGGFSGSPSRQFEQESKFADGLDVKATVVQCTEAAVTEILGATALADIKDITALYDLVKASDSWAYVG